MATTLENYQARRADYESKLVADSFPPEDLMAFQELNYRICVLETFQLMLKATPITMDMTVISYHYQIIGAYVGLLLKERKFGPKMDETQQKKRDTALASLENVVNDGKKRFGSFSAANQDYYKKCIGNFCNVVLPMWMQYRETYIKL